MSDSRARVWKKIGCFYLLTILFSCVFDAFVLGAGKMDAGNLLYVTGSMWSPALAAFLTKAMFGESLRDLPWAWGRAKYAWLGYFIPVAYAVPIYIGVWLTGLGVFANTEFITKTAETFGWANFPPVIVVLLFVLFTATLGLIGKTSRARRGDRLARVSRARAIQGHQLYRRRTDQRRDVVGLSLPCPHLRGLQRGHSCLVWTDVLHARGHRGEFHSRLADPAVRQSLAGRAPARQSQSLDSIDPDTAHA